jgi:hypothetical protein
MTAGREGFAKDAKEDLEMEVFCAFCESFAPFAFRKCFHATR